MGLGWLGSQFVFEVYDYLLDMFMLLKMLGGGLLLVVMVCSVEVEVVCYEKGFIYVIFYVLDFICVVVGLVSLEIF